MGDGCSGAAQPDAPDSTTHNNEPTENYLRAAFESGAEGRRNTADVPNSLQANIVGTEEGARATPLAGMARPRRAVTQRDQRGTKRALEVKNTLA